MGFFFKYVDMSNMYLSSQNSTAASNGGSLKKCHAGQNPPGGRIM